MTIINVACVNIVIDGDCGCFSLLHVPVGSPGTTATGTTATTATTATAAVYLTHGPYIADVNATAPDVAYVGHAVAVEVVARLLNAHVELGK